MQHFGAMFHNDSSMSKSTKHSRDSDLASNQHKSTQSTQFTQAPTILSHPTPILSPSNPDLQDSREGRAVVGVVAALEPQRSEQAELDWRPSQGRVTCQPLNKLCNYGINRCFTKEKQSLYLSYEYSVYVYIYIHIYICVCVCVNH